MLDLFSSTLIIILISSLIYYKLVYQIKSLPSLKGLSGKNVIITGASWGIGEQIVYHCASNGASKIVIAARRANLLEKVAKKVTDENPNCQVKIVVCNLGVQADCEKLINESVEFFGKLGINLLILNHTMSVFDHIDFTDPRSTIQKARDITNVNLMGFISLAQLAIPSMKNPTSSDQPNSIIAVSTLIATVSLGMSWAYSATKSAINAYFLCLSDELVNARLPITVTIAHLGAINTEQWRLNATLHPLQFVEANYGVASPKTTAEMILRHGLAGIREFYYPIYGEIVKISYCLAPSFSRWIHRKIAKEL